MSSASRIAHRFAALAAAKRAGLVTFVTAGDPDFATSAAIVRGLAAAGADIIELGMPFSDPMADGPAIQLASQRALKSGQTMQKTFEIVANLRRDDQETPVVLMGYFNPIHRFGVARFAEAAARAGVDGMIVVDLPPEEDDELRLPARGCGLDLIRLVTPTTDDARLAKIAAHASGFLYYVSVAGVTGTKSAAAGDVAVAVARISRASALPVAVGFGIRTAVQAEAVARVAAAAVVGSAIVDRVAAGVAARQRDDELVRSVLGLVAELATGVRRAAAEPARKATPA